MMKFILFVFFLTPFLFINYWFLIQFFFIFLMLLFLVNSCYGFFGSVSYFFGIDNISYGLIILSIMISSLMILSSSSIFGSLMSSFFLFCCYLLMISLILIFCVMKMIIMYFFFEFSLIPLFLIIMGWGYQPERLISGLYLFFYTLLASLPLLLVIIYLYMSFGSMSFDYNFGVSLSFMMHFMMLIAFMVKLPLYMFHLWLPKAHVQAPVSGSMILAGLLLKIGGYGILRFMFIYEYLFINFSWFWYSLSLVGSCLVSLVCLIQGDVKCLIAYSSIAHMCMCLMGMLSMTKFGLIGSYLMMIGHGLCSSGLFCLANISYERFLSRSFFINKGLMLFMPSMSMMWFMFCSFNMSCPPSINFISEIMIMNSMIMYWSGSLIFIIFMSFFTACFSFYLFSFTQHGKYHNLYCYSLGNVREYLLMIVHLMPLFLIILFMDCIFW
ncbi:NADH dehydrogenase subunit 4 (mitochondrion) [Homalodisca vitripennis]|nr:NADH dehydrogenase subunit 4 [Homalodisca vitripennis]